MKLTGSKIKNTYGGLLNIGPTGMVGSNVYQVTDGFGNPVPMLVGQTEVNFIGDLFVNGIEVDPKSGFYGSFFSDQTQTNPGATAANVITCNQTSGNNEIFLVSNSQITFNRDGVYNIQFSCQFDKTDSGNDDVEIWFAKNGVNIPSSSSQVTLSGNNTKTIPAWNFVLEVNSGDYVQIYWHSNDLNMRILATPATSNPSKPAIPSVIITAVQVTNILAGATGTSGTSGTSGVSGTSGTSGVSGTSGTSGVSGTSGTSGVTGAAGANGTSGTSGTSGVTGPSGVSGTSGTSGIGVGVPTGGLTGQVLAKIDGTDYNTKWVNQTGGTGGASGTSGTSGVSGTSGTSGVSGTSGTSGINGTSGTSGVTGAQGPAGANGTSGTSGVSGTSGTSGINGTSGTSGLRGATGATGVNGTSGTSGINGTSGTSGITGAQGIQGPTGSIGPTGSTGAKGDPGADAGLSLRYRIESTSGTPIPSVGRTTTDNPVVVDITQISFDVEDFYGVDAKPYWNQLVTWLSIPMNKSSLIITTIESPSVKGIFPITGITFDSVNTYFSITLDAPIYSNGILTLGNTLVTSWVGEAVGLPGPTGPSFSIENPANNRILTSNTSGTGAIAEQNLTFDGQELRVTGQGVSNIYSIGTTSGNVLINWDNGNTQTVTLNGTTTLSYSNVIAGGVYNLQVTIGSTSAVTWPSGTRFAGGSTAAFSTTTNSIDLVTVIAGGTGTTLLTVVNKDFK